MRTFARLQWFSRQGAGPRRILIQFRNSAVLQFARGPLVRDRRGGHKNPSRRYPFGISFARKPEMTMATQNNKVDQQESANTSEPAVPSGKGPRSVPKDTKDPGQPSPNLHHEHQDCHGSGEGLTGMQPGAGHPRGR